MRSNYHLWQCFEVVLKFSIVSLEFLIVFRLGSVLLVTIVVALACAEPVTQSLSGKNWSSLSVSHISFVFQLMVRLLESTSGQRTRSLGYGRETKRQSSLMIKAIGLLPRKCFALIKKSFCSCYLCSYVAFTSEGERLIGEAAKNQAALNPENTVWPIVLPFSSFSPLIF